MSENVIVGMEISKIKIEVRTRKNFDHVPDLAESIAEQGQLQPILVDSENTLIAGACRIKALLSLNRTHVQAIVIPIEQLADREMAEWAENNVRKDFVFSEKIAIAKALEKRLKDQGERRGKKSKGITNKEDTNVADSPQLGEKTRDFIAKRAGFSSTKICRDVLEVTEKAIPQVIEAMDKSEISVYAAVDIAQHPLKQQLKHLLTALKRCNVETDEPTIKPRKANRKIKHEAPCTHIPHPIFNVIHIAPDWGNDLSGILQTPVNDYASPEFAIIAIECTPASLPLAIQSLEHWNFTYKITLTIWNPDGMHISGYGYHHQDARHIVIGDRCGGKSTEMPFLDKINKISPVIIQRCEPLNDLSVIEAMFSSKIGKRIDMSSSERRKGWTLFKTIKDSNDIDIEEEQETVECNDFPVNVTEVITEYADPFEAPRKRVLKVF